MRNLLNKAICWLRGHDLEAHWGIIAYSEQIPPPATIADVTKTIRVEIGCAGDKRWRCVRCGYIEPQPLSINDLLPAITSATDSIEAQYNAPSALFTKNLSE